MSPTGAPVSEIVLVANARLPSERAQSLQVVQASAALARQGPGTTLLYARRQRTPRLPEGTDLFSYYGVPDGPRPSLQPVPCIDWIDRVPRRLQYLPARIQELTFSRNAAHHVLRALPDAVVLSRELEAARGLIRKGRRRVFLEVHRVPGGATRRRWLREAAAGAAGVLAISGGVREDLLALGVDQDSVRVEHDAFEPARFAAAPDREQARAELGLAPDAPLVVYTGGLLAWNNRQLPPLQSFS